MAWWHNRWFLSLTVGLLTFSLSFLLLFTLNNRNNNSSKKSPTQYISSLLKRGNSCQNGLLIRNGECFCNLGWKGSTCDTRDTSTLQSSKGPQNSYLLVVDHFSPSDVDAPNAIYHSSLATFLQKSGFSVTVLVLQPPSNKATFDGIVKLFAAQKITVTSLPSLGRLKFGVRPPVETSYRLFRYLADGKDKWGSVIIASSTGAAYYPLLAAKQGLACLPAQIHLLVEEPGAVATSNILRPNHTVVDPEVLRVDYLQQKSFELAPVVLVPNKPIHDLIVESGWTLGRSSSLFLVPPLTLPVKQQQLDLKASSNNEELLERADEMIASRQTLVREFVFVGRLGASGGLHIFLNAIDSLLSRDAKSHRKLLKGIPLKVTFFGVNDVIDVEGDLTGEHYIEAKAYAWAGKVKWAIAGGDRSLKRIVKYITEPGKGRVAVVPAITESTSFFLHQALRAGVPVLASNLKCSQEIVHIQDRRDVLFTVNDSSSLAKRLADVWVHGAVIGRPATPLKQLQSQWMQVLAEVNSRPIGECPAALFKADQVMTHPPKSPLISVILVHYNRVGYLKQAIASLEAQTMKDFQVILVDDGSTDAEAVAFLDSLTFTWWQEKSWKVLREPNRYLGAARNTGAKHANGKYLLFMDDDDIAKPDQLEVMLRVAEVTGADVVTTGHDTFVSKNAPGAGSNVARYVPLGAAANVGIWENCFGDSNFLVHRQFFLDSQGFTKEYGVGFEDYEYLAKVVLRDNHLEPLAEPMHWYRQHGKSMSGSTDLKANRMRFLRSYHEMMPFLGNLTKANVQYAQWSFFEKNANRPFFQEICGCNATTCDTGTSSSSTTTSTSTSTSTTSSSTTSSTGSATRAITTFSSFTFLNSTTSESSSSSSTSSTSSSSTSSTSLVLTSLLTSACPCRTYKKKRTTFRSTSSKVSKPTCFTTMTVTPTLTRTAKPCTLLRTVVVDNCEGSNCIDLSALSNLDNQVTSVTYFMDQPPPKAPLAIAADFLPKGNEIVVRFDAPVNAPIGKAHPCEDWLETKPLGIPNAAFLGAECTAMFVSPVEMRVRVNPKFLAQSPVKKSRIVAPNQLLVFRQGVLGNTGSLNRGFVSGSIEIAPPENAERPVVVVRAPSFLGNDDSLKVDLSASYGSGGRPFIDALFEVTSAIGELYTAQDAPLRQFLHSAAVEAVKAQQHTFEIPADLLSDYTTYHFDFTLWNVFGESGSTRLTISKVPKAAVPPVLIIGNQKQPKSRPLVLTALIDLPKNVPISAFDFAWFLIKSPQPLKLSKNKRPMLVVDAGNLAVGRYVFGLQVTAASGASMTFTHMVDIEPVNFSMAIYGGSRQISSSDFATLKVVSSQQEINVKWTCRNAADGGPCVSKVDGAMVELEEGSEAGFDAKLLGPGDYEVEAIGSDGFNTQADKVIISVAPGELTLPKVMMLAERSTEDDSLHLKAVLDDAAPMIEGATPQHSFRWESAPYCNGEHHAVLDSFGRLRKSVFNDTELLVKLSSSQLLPGASYCFKVTAYSGDTGNTAFAYQVVRGKETADGGFCRLDSPSVGVALSTSFAASCHGFDSQNVLYRFKVKRRNDIIQLAPASSVPRISRVLDLGHWDVLVDVLDVNDGSVIRSLSVKKISTRLSDDKSVLERDEYLAKNLALFETTHNTDHGYAILAIAMASPTPFKHGTSSPSLAQMLNLLDILSLNTPIDSFDSGPMLFKALLKLLPPKMPLDLRPVSLRVLHRLVDEITSASKSLPKELAISSLQALQPLYANARGGSSASFTINAIFDHVEKAFRPLGSTFAYTHLNWTSGVFDSAKTEDICNGVITNLRLPKNDTFNYRCIEADANHMRNYTTDNWAFSFGLYTGNQTLVPLLLESPFNITLKLSRPNLLRVIRKRAEAKCSFYDRGSNAASSWWSDEHCTLVQFDQDAGTVTCECRWLMSDYAVTLIPTKLGRSLRWLKYLTLVTVLVCLILTVVYWRHYVKYSMAAGFNKLRSVFWTPKSERKRMGSGSTIVSANSIISSASTIPDVSNTNNAD